MPLIAKRVIHTLIIAKDEDTMTPGAAAPATARAETASDGQREDMPTEAGLPSAEVTGSGTVRLKDMPLRGGEDATPLPCPHLMKSAAGELTLPRMKEADDRG